MYPVEAKYGKRSDDRMNKLLILLLSVTLVFIPVFPVHANEQLTKEQLLEETLMLRYLPVLSDVIHEQFMCEKITDIRRINHSNRDYKLSIDVITFEEAHNPPNDLITIEIRDTTSEGINVTSVQRQHNLSAESVRLLCKR